VNSSIIIRWFIIFFLIITGCAPKTAPVETEPEVIIEAPTPTEVPMAACVNGDGIPLADYEAEIKRYQDALNQLGEQLDPEAIKTDVLDEMIKQLLLVQGAYQSGFSVSDADVQAKYNELASELGSEDALRTWIFENHYDDQTFRRALTQELAAIWMRNQIIASVPLTAEQVHARQIQVNDENLAVSIERQLQVGSDFESLARQYDPQTGGDLGWFPRGYLLQPDIENAAFSLNPGEYSPIIRTSYGYHIVYVVEKDDQHPLSPDGLAFMRRNAVQNWLTEKQEQSTIEVITP